MREAVCCTLALDGYGVAAASEVTKPRGIKAKSGYGRWNARDEDVLVGMYELDLSRWCAVELLKGHYADKGIGGVRNVARETHVIILLHAFDEGGDGIELFFKLIGIGDQKRRGERS